MKVPLSSSAPVHLTPRRHRPNHFLVHRKKPVQRRCFVPQSQHAQRAQNPRQSQVIMIKPRHPVSRSCLEIRSARDDTCSFLPGFGFVADFQAVKFEHPLQSAAETGSQLGLGEEGAADFGRDDGREAEHALFGEREDGLDVVVGAFELGVWPGEDGGEGAVAGVWGGG